MISSPVTIQPVDVRKYVAFREGATLRMVGEGRTEEKALRALKAAERALMRRVIREL